MASQSGSARFQALFESALREYEKKTGVTLAEHSLAKELQNCDSVDAITALLHDRAQTFNDYRENDRILKLIRTTVSILTPLSSAASLADAIGVTLITPAKAVTTCLGILLDAAKGVITSCDVLADLLESIGHFVDRLSIYTRIDLMPELDEIVIKILVELISTLGLVTEKLKQRRSIKFMKNFFGDKDIEAVLQRLDRLTQEEARTTAAETLLVVYELAQNMQRFMSDSKTSIGGLREALENLHERASDMNKQKRDERLRGIRNWLSPPNPRKNLDTALHSRHEETGSWFVNGEKFSEWKAPGPSSLLWINGKPGAGKTILCSTIIEDIGTMQKSGLASLAMHYYDFRVERKKGLRELLSSVLFQLSRQSDSYCDIVSKLRSEHDDGFDDPSDYALIRCLKRLLELPRQAPIFLIVDALDECPNTPALSSPRKEVLILIKDLVSSQLPNLRICVTSRPETDIQVILEHLALHSVSLHNELGQKDDMQSYIESIVNTNENMKNWSPEHKQLVIDVLTERADGMFQWVCCQLEYLAGCPPVHIKRALDELPETLDETYERTLREIKDTKWEAARRLLLCVATASRPLQAEELAEILAFDFEAGPIPKLYEGCRLENPVQAVLSTCSTLLSLVNVKTYSGSHQLIQFSHLSVKEFLESSRFAEKRETISRRYHISMTPAHTVLAQACLGSLLHLDENITRANLAQFPLASYAAEHWFEHVRFEGVTRSVVEGVRQLFDPKKPHLSVWIWICDPTTHPWDQKEQAERPLSPHGTPLHYAASCGLHDFVKVLAIEHPQDVNSRSFRKEQEPLHLASVSGHVDVVRLLIEYGADAAAKDEDGLTPLHQASRWGHVDLARTLIEHGVDASARDNDGSTPLHLASKGGHVDLAQMLIDKGANAAAQDNYGSSPLHTASAQGDEDLARILIKHGADVAAQNEAMYTPLHYASEKRHVNLARILVEHGADAEVRGEHGWTPLHHATFWRNMDLAQILIEYGANPTTKDENGVTPLHRAMIYRDVGLVRFLVKHGAGVLAQEEDGWAPLLWASERGLHDVVRTFVELGADVVAQDENGASPLHWALEDVEDGDVDLAIFLIERGADAAARKKDGTTPLHLASRYCDVDFARFLIEHGADYTAQSEYRGTPLHEASSWNNVDVARFLIERGADVMSQDRRGCTPLHKASLFGQLDLVQLLIEHGAETGAQDKDGKTPLHQASSGDFSDVQVARILVEHGADVAAQDKRGDTPLHLASLIGRCLDRAQFLVENGANVAAQNADGLTPLDLARRYDHLEFVQFFVEHDAGTAAEDMLRIQLPT